jgi:hypothetical protein
MEMPGDEPEQPHRPLVQLRSTLILLLSALTGVGAGILTYLGAQPWSIAVLAGVAAGAAAIRFFDTFIS